ncbi:hypothetical protein [Absidia glauca]|uniref:DNA polymerase n=1 Tax=Absidia glauca TaxID=4829 RepID=A0A168R3T5_ABSGL|nr:hypothetical protein [Absidia glauca]
MSSPSPFAQHKFYILPVKLDQDRIKSLEEGIVSLEGTCLSHLTDATFVITGLKSPARIQRHIPESPCPVVHANWITECVTQQRFMDPTSYRIQVVPLTSSNNDDGDDTSVRPQQMRSWDDIYATYRQQCRRPVSKHAILHGYDPGRKKKRKKATIRREPSYQTTTSGGESSLEQGHPWWAETSLYQATTYICEQPSPLDHCNQALVDIFEFLEHTRELRGDTINGLSYRKAAAVLKTYPHKIKSAHEALQLKGIGKKTGRIIEDYLKTGEVPDIAMVKADEEFKTLELFYNIHGVGATTAREWYNKGHRSMEDITAHEQLSKDQLLGIKYYDDFLQRIPREQVEAIVGEFAALLHTYQSGCDYTVCGSYRRGKASSGDIDILVTHPDEKVTQTLLMGLVDRLQTMGYIKDVLSMSGRGDEEASNQNRQALCVWLSKGATLHRRLDLIVVPWCDYAVAILGWTGSRYFERSLRLRAKQMKGLKVTSHGIFRKDEKLKVETERQAFEVMDLPYLEPSDRNC